MTSLPACEPERVHYMQHTSSAPLPAGSLRGLLSRTLARGRSTEHVPRRKHKSRPSSPVPNKDLGTAVPAASPRTRSTSWSAQGPRKLSKDGKCWSTRKSSAKHPPPFAEAFRHAIIHAKLETPVLSGNVRRDKSATSSPAMGIDVHASPLTCPRQSSRSNSEDYNLASRIFILTDDGCVLQYQLDGASNRTPERILELGPQSISVASDAIPGKHWVLNVVCDGRHDTPQPSLTLKPTRSRMFLRQPSEVKRYARDLLLVFADDCTFNQWLICVRKEIEALGGLEYRPDSRGASGLLQLGQTAAELAHVPDNVSPLKSRRTSDTRRDMHGVEADVQAWKAGTVSPRSTSGSSVGSSADLNRLRASTIDAHSLESGTGSSYVEAIPQQGIPEINVMHLDASQPNALEPHRTTATRRKKSITPILVLPDSRHGRSASCSPSLPSPQFPRTPTLATDTVHCMAGAFGKPISPVSPTSPFRPDQTPFSFMQSFQFTPCTSAEIMPTISNADEVSISSTQPTPRRSFSFESQSLRSQAEFDSFADDQQSTPDRSSIDEGTRDCDSPPPAYTLVPRRKSSLVFQQSFKHESFSMESLVGLGISGHLRTGSGLTPFVFPSRSQGRDSPPVTTDATKPLTLNSHVAPQTKAAARPDHLRDSIVHRMSRQKSMPNLLFASGAPVAPPPSVPLPAIPRDAPGGPRRAELKFARCLSALNGFRPVDAATAAAPAAPEVSFRLQKRSIGKSPPPSTWEAWKSFPTLTSSAPMLQRNSGAPRSTTPSPAVQAQTSAGASGRTVAPCIDESLLMRQHSFTDGGSGEPRADGQDTVWQREDEARQPAMVKEKTIVVNGFRFPMAI